MPVLNWIGKEYIVNHDKEIPFRLLKKIKNLSRGDSENLIMEGDNLEGLKALFPYYQNKIKCIFIDPPYNTGNEKWIYNDNVNSPKIKQWLGKVVGGQGEDLTRHDKWLCMMYPRLKLLRELLKNDGLIFISIDDTEQHYLRQILDEIFGLENFIANIIWQKKHTSANDARFISDNHDLILMYAKNADKLKINLLQRTDEHLLIYSNPDNDPRGNWTSGPIQAKTPSAKDIYEIITPSGRKIMPPKGTSWRFSKQKFAELVKDNRIWFGEDGKNIPRIKRFLTEVREGIIPKTIWTREEAGDNQEAKQELQKLLPEEVFPTPKPVRLIKRILQISTDRDDLVLDSFAGSGTTGQAVLELNKEDKGNRKFILIEMENKICREITSQRIKKVIDGYSYNHTKVNGLKGGFQYCVLSKSLFDKDGKIDESCSFEDLASYIYFTETKMILDRKIINKNFIGEHVDTKYYLLFRGIGKNTLTTAFLKRLSKESRKIIYADNCTVSEEELEKYRTIFKQIPYEVRVF